MLFVLFRGKNNQQPFKRSRKINQTFKSMFEKSNIQSMYKYSEVPNNDKYLTHAAMKALCKSNNLICIDCPNLLVLYVYARMCNQVLRCTCTNFQQSHFFKVAGNHVNKIHDCCKQLNFSGLECLCRRHFALRFACLPIDIDHGKF